MSPHPGAGEGAAIAPYESPSGLFCLVMQLHDPHHSSSSTDEPADLYGGGLRDHSLPGGLHLAQERGAYFSKDQEQRNDGFRSRADLHSSGGYIHTALVFPGKGIGAAR